MQATMGSRIAGRRVENRWTQDQLAERAGLSPKYLSRVERDHVNPGAALLSRIAEALGVTMDYLNNGSVNNG
jgi:transcriptional regulator with XRE-family HTH domain